MFKIDGREFNVFIPEEGIEMEFNILDGENAGRLQKGGEMYRDIIGTFYTYKIKIDTNRLDPQEYDDLFEILSSPVDSHELTVPYGQSEITFDAYITKGGHKLKQQYKGVNYYEGLTLEFVSMKALREPE